MQWLEGAAAGQLFLSVLVLGEIRRGIERLRPRDPRQAAGYEGWLETLTLAYAGRVLPVTAAVAHVWGHLNAPRMLPAADSLMLATAQLHGLTFVTRNTVDVAGTGVPVLNPFSP